MPPVIIKIIKEDLEKQFNLNELNLSDEIFVHHNICQYIRNKFLWNKEKTTKILFKYFQIYNVDDLSYKILEKIKRDYF